MKNIHYVLFLFVLSLLCTSCRSSHGGITAKFLNNGYHKPIVVVLPVKDQIDSKAYAPSQNWDISKEITDEIYNRLSKRGELILLSQEQSKKMKEVHEQLQAENCDFKVLVELVDHKTIKYERGEKARIYPRLGNIDHLIEMRYRIIVKDMRPGKNGKVVLRELQDSHHPVILDEKEINYDHIDKNGSYYKNTPLGRGHARLAAEISNRIADYLPYLNSM